MNWLKENLFRERSFYDFEPIDYLTYGKHCISIAKKLKDGSDKVESNYPMRILLTHGIELILKSVIQKYDAEKFKEIREHHDLIELYDAALKIDIFNELNILTNNDLNKSITDFVSKYYPDTVKARYKNKDSMLDFSIFMILRENLIEPLERIICL